MGRPTWAIATWSTEWNYGPGRWVPPREVQQTIGRGAPALNALETALVLTAASKRSVIDAAQLPG
jgi:hypothetical protein